MEHPLRVEEFSPAEAAPTAPAELVADAAPATAAHATSLPPLPNLPASDVLFLKPTDAHYADYLAAANIRTRLNPALRAVCQTEHAVAVMVDWVRGNNLNFAVRCGGHSYEGLSQSVDVVIDVRGLDTITVDKSAGLVTAGSGASLYQIYQAIAAQGLALQAGSCPTVGMSSPLSVQSLGFLDAVKHFAGPLAYEQVYMKAKSDYALSPLGSAGIDAMMAAVAPVVAGGIVLLCDSYGGKISDVAADATAFPRRAGTQYCIQYYSSWIRAADTPAHLAQVAKVYAAMRPYLPGASYVNYCDLDLPDYAAAYWGDNLARLMAVKQHYDPDNLFYHAQSVPVSVPTV